MFTSLLERIPLTVIVIVLGLCALRSSSCRLAVYCLVFVRRGFLNQQARGQTTRIVCRRERARLSLRCDFRVAATENGGGNTIKMALLFLHFKGKHMRRCSGGAFVHIPD
jgi:hypothetical protein